MEQHHRPDGMIALCREHADKADNGAFTLEQLRDFKTNGANAAPGDVGGSFDWMRSDLLAVVGGNFYYRCPVILRLRDRRCIWFNRDDDGYLLLNFVMPSLTREPRGRIEDNFWTVTTEADEVVCPPSGRLVDVRYQNGDRFRAEFFNTETADNLLARYPGSSLEVAHRELVFPLTVVELWETAAGTKLEFGPAASQIGPVQMTGGFIPDIAEAAIQINVPETQLAALFPREEPG